MRKILPEEIFALCPLLGSRFVDFSEEAVLDKTKLVNFFAKKTKRKIKLRLLVFSIGPRSLQIWAESIMGLNAYRLVSE